MSLISAWAQSSRQPVTLILNLRGRLAYSRLPVKNSEIARATRQGVEDLVGVDARHRAAQDVAGRVAARLDRRQPDLVEAAPRCSGTSAMRTQWSWMSWRVVMSP